jgi:Ser/Thr protein kinase RdoA (MazF antagonist)
VHEGEQEMDRAVQAAENFIIHGATIAGVEEHGHGFIHDTYLVKLDNGARFILQRLNTDVFLDPAAVMHNIRLVCQHMQERMKVNDSGINANWQILQSLPARDGRNFFLAADKSFWRAFSFIREAIALEQITSLRDAREVGRALGLFHLLVSDLKPELLHTTLPGFHNVEHYLQHYDEVLTLIHKKGETGMFCQQFIEDRKRWAPVLEKGRREKLLRVRIIHGDPKINNIMINRKTAKAVSIIDLDTVMPGLVQYDIADCLRSCCNAAGEEIANLSEVRFDLERCRAVLSGYTGAARNFLTDRDFDFLYDAMRLIPFELGLRFYTDFLEGNVYFKVSHADQNLERAMVQFKLAESIEQQEKGLRKVIEECHGAYMRTKP